jgi:hypothetical protein
VIEHKLSILTIVTASAACLLYFPQRVRRSASPHELRFGSAQEMTCTICHWIRPPPVTISTTVSEHYPLPEMIFVPTTTTSIIVSGCMGRTIISSSGRRGITSPPMKRKSSESMTSTTSSLQCESGGSAVDDSDDCSYVSSLSSSSRMMIDLAPLGERQRQEQESSSFGYLRAAFYNILQVQAIGDPCRKLILTLPAYALEIVGLTRNAYDIILACVRTWLDPQRIQEFVLEDNGHQHTSSLSFLLLSSFPFAPTFPTTTPLTTSLSCHSQDDQNVSSDEYSVDALTNDIMLLAAAKESITDQWERCIGKAMADISELVDVVSLESKTENHDDHIYQQMVSTTMGRDDRPGRIIREQRDEQEQPTFT